MLPEIEASRTGRMRTVRFPNNIARNLGMPQRDSGELVLTYTQGSNLMDSVAVASPAIFEEPLEYSSAAPISIRLCSDAKDL
jgi:hypothetical protein